MCNGIPLTNRCKKRQHEALARLALARLPHGSASFMPIPLTDFHAVAISPEGFSISALRSANRKEPAVPLASTPRRRPHHPACQATRIPASQTHEPLARPRQPGSRPGSYLRSGQ
jgi:hypothetical protein